MATSPNMNDQLSGKILFSGAAGELRRAQAGVDPAEQPVDQPARHPSCSTERDAGRRRGSIAAASHRPNTTPAATT